MGNENPVCIVSCTRPVVIGLRQERHPLHAGGRPGHQGAKG